MLQVGAACTALPVRPAALHLSLGCDPSLRASTLTLAAAPQVSQVGRWNILTDNIELAQTEEKKIHHSNKRVCSLGRYHDSRILA